MIPTKTMTANIGTQDGVGQRQALPDHVHEDRDDQPGLDQHEEQDQRPPQIALQADVVDHVGAGAEHEQPAPDDEVDLQRMVLALLVRRRRRRVGGVRIVMCRAVGGRVSHVRLTTDRRMRR